jgi:hypothetical protein
MPVASHGLHPCGSPAPTTMASRLDVRRPEIVLAAANERRSLPSTARPSSMQRRLTRPRHQSRCRRPKLCKSWLPLAHAEWSPRPTGGVPPTATSGGRLHATGDLQPGVRQHPPARPRCAETFIRGVVRLASLRCAGACIRGPHPWCCSPQRLASPVACSVAWRRPGARPGPPAGALGFPCVAMAHDRYLPEAWLAAAARADESLTTASSGLDWDRCAWWIPRMFASCLILSSGRGVLDGLPQCPRVSL